MARQTVVRTLLDVGRSVTELTALIDDPAAPGLGVWDIRGLAGHLLRAFRTPITYLGLAPAVHAEHADAVAYFVAYLERRDSAPDATDDHVADRGSEELAGADGPAIATAYRSTMEALEAALDAAPDAFVIASPFGAIALTDYLETRVFEATVHGLDLAAALEAESWRPPPDAMRLSLGLLTELAVRRNMAGPLLRALTGRSAEGFPPLLR